MSTVAATGRSTFESAVSVLEVLPEDSQKKVLGFSIRLLHEEEDSPFRPKSEVELLERIDHSLSQIETGEYRDADEVCDEILAELDL